MRFCIVSTQQHWGGGEELLSSFDEQLVRSGHSVSWILRRDSEVAKRLADRDVLLEIGGRGRSLSAFLQTRTALRQWSPDVLIMNDTHAVVMAGLVAKFGLSQRPLRLAFKHTIFPLRSKFKYKFLTDKIICVSQAARKTVLEGGLPDSSAVVVYGGMQCDAHGSGHAPPTLESPDLSQDLRQDLRQEFNLDPQRQMVLSVGNLLKCKGHSHLLQAIAAIQAADRPYLLIAGEGEERSHLEQLIQRLKLQDDVQLLGYRHDTPSLMRAADLIAHPSLAEGLSLVLIQAQLLRRPILATAVGGAAEVLNSSNNDSEGHWIVKPSDTSDLERQLRAALLTLKKPTQGLQVKLDQAETRTRQLFSIESNSRRLSQLAQAEIANLELGRKAA